jgi:hypothetical protein
MKKQIMISMVLGTVLIFAIAALAGLPNPGMKVVAGRTALVITDPQNDFLSPKGVTWGVVGKSVTENNTVENIERLFKTAKANGMPVLVSPHYYYPTDHGWKFEGALEVLMHNIGMFDRKGPLNLEGWNDTSLTSKMGKRWLSVHIKSMVRKPTIWFCSSESVVLTRSYLRVCLQTSAQNRTCVSCWSRVLRLLW